VDEWVGCGRLQVGDKWEKASAEVDGEADERPLYLLTLAMTQPAK
jgi:hypothetical protein